MNSSLIALALQVETADDSSMWIILAVVLVILFFVVVIIVVAVVIFFFMRKRSKAQQASAGSSAAISSGEGSYGAITPADSTPAFDSASSVSASPSMPEGALDGGISDPEVFDPTRTVAITREDTAQISFGSINFVSGVLSGQTFEVNAAGSYIGREGTMAEIVVADPRISKRHLWIGVRNGLVTIEDQNSRNGTFLNDPKSERVTQASLQSGDTVILGESDVARFEYHD